MNELAPDLPRQDLFRFTASIRFLSPAEGGRGTPIASRHCPDCWFGLRDARGEQLLHGCHLYFRAGDDAFEKDGDLWVRPGEQCRADVLVRRPSFLRGQIAVGGTFDVREGLRVIGSGRIESIFDPGPENDPA